MPTPEEIQTWASEANKGGLIDRLSESIEHRASQGDPRSRLVLAKNWDEAFAVIQDVHPNSIKLKESAPARVGRASCRVIGMAVVAVPNAIRIQGYQKNFHTTHRLSGNSLDMTIGREDARALAEMILKALG